jgi:hypothetical protein
MVRPIQIKNHFPERQLKRDSPKYRFVHNRTFKKFIYIYWQMYTNRHTLYLYPEVIYQVITLLQD